MNSHLKNIYSILQLSIICVATENYCYPHFPLLVTGHRLYIKQKKTELYIDIFPRYQPSGKESLNFFSVNFLKLCSFLFVCFILVLISWSQNRSWRGCSWYCNLHTSQPISRQEKSVLDNRWHFALRDYIDFKQLCSKNFPC